MTYLGKKIKIISKQLTDAQKTYPDLVEAYNYMVGYIGFLTNRLQRRELRFEFGGIPEQVHPPNYPNKGDLICEIFGENSLSP